MWIQDGFEFKMTTSLPIIRYFTWKMISLLLFSVHSIWLFNGCLEFLSWLLQQESRGMGPNGKESSSGGVGGGKTGGGREGQAAWLLDFTPLPLAPPCLHPCSLSSSKSMLPPSWPIMLPTLKLQSYCSCCWLQAAVSALAVVLGPDQDQTYSSCLPRPVLESRTRLFFSLRVEWGKESCLGFE